MGFLTPNAHGEQDVLATFAVQQLTQIRAAIHGLTDEQVRSTPTASTMSPAWIGLHTAAVARSWAQMVTNGRAPEDDEQGAGADEPTASTTVDEVDRALERAIGELDQRLRASDLDLSDPIQVPEAPWYPPELKTWEKRWAYAHLIGELARHAGHADILRESIDGKGSFELNDLAEGKEPVDWSAQQ